MKWVLGKLLTLVRFPGYGQTHCVDAGSGSLKLNIVDKKHEDRRDIYSIEYDNSEAKGQYIVEGDNVYELYSEELGINIETDTEVQVMKHNAVVGDEWNSEKMIINGVEQTFYYEVLDFTNSIDGFEDLMVMRFTISMGFNSIVFINLFAEGIGLIYSTAGNEGDKDLIDYHIEE